MIHSSKTPRPKWAITILFIFLVGILLGTAAAGAADPGQPIPNSGEEAIKALDARLPEVAAAYGMTAAQLQALFQQDPTLHVGANGELFHIDPPFFGDAAASQPTEGPAPILPFPVEDTFLLNSRPSASHTIYLDFDGHTTIGTSWNSNYGIATIVSPPYDIDANPGSFSPKEIENIQKAWQLVSEDYSPFDVNVTTQDPGAAALSFQGAGDEAYGARVVITNDTFASCGCGGFAFIGSFDDSQDEPVFVFNSTLIGLAEASSHEVGHAINLSHDGQGSSAYYTGHGGGATSWAPIMGASYYTNVSHWSKGEYYQANNGGLFANYGAGPDDLAIIASLSNGNGFGYRPDDHGDDQAGATELTNVTNSVNAAGVIERTSDVDVFRFTTGGGQVDLSIEPAVLNPNLDVLAELRDSSWNIISTSNPPAKLYASFSESLTAGTYYLIIDGTGAGSPLNDPPTGYTEYGSLGQYTITGTIPAGEDSKIFLPTIRTS